MKRSDLIKMLAPIPKEFAWELIENYVTDELGTRRIPEGREFITEFSFPRDIMQKIVDTKKSELFLALALHEGADSSTYKYTLIAMTTDYKGILDITNDSSPAWAHHDQSNLTILDAKNMIKAYREKRPIPYKKGVKKMLKGCSFPIAELDDILAQDNVHNVKFIIGYHIEPHRPENQVGYTLIMVGGDSDNNPIWDKQIFEFCDPCPRKCPENIDFPYFI